MKAGARLLVAVLLLIPVEIAGQDKPLVEIGTDIGISMLSGDGTTLTYVGAPAQSFRGQPGLYATFFSTGPVCIEPRIALSIADFDNGSTTALGFGASIGYLFNGPAAGSPFLAADFGLMSSSTSWGSIDVSDSDFGLGVTAGYRSVIDRGLGLRVNVGFKRWFDSDYTEFRIGVGIGGIVHRGR